MFSQMQGELPQFLIEAQNSPYFARAKKLLLVMLGLWMTAIVFAVALFRFARSPE